MNKFILLIMLLCVPMLSYGAEQTRANNYCKADINFKAYVESIQSCKAVIPNANEYHSPRVQAGIDTSPSSSR